MVDAIPQRESRGEGAEMLKWRLLIGAVVLAAAGWSAWWFVGAAAHDRALNGWLADRRAEGWQAEVADLTTQGFPNRFDTRLTDLQLADPEVGWAWRAPFVDIMMLSYQPNAAVVALPPEQTLAAPGARAKLTSELLRGSIRFVPGLSLALSRLSVEGRGLALEGADWRAGAATLAAHVREAAAGSGPENGYDIYFEAGEVALPNGVRDRLDPSGGLPEVAQLLRIDAKAAFDRPLDRYAVEDAPPRPTAISLTSLDAAWGGLALKASGRVRADAEGYADGQLDVRAENWREMLRLAVASGAMDRDMAGLIEQGLGLLAALSGDGDAIEAPVRFSGGRAWIGPIPVGRAPRMLQRQ
jgi:hypothetical protein